MPESRSMLLRFCLYGFLKNQRYFDPFLILVFVEKGLSFGEIGLLIAIREIVVNLLEIPSGAIADLFGRRRSIVMAFVTYLVSFPIFAGADSFWALAGAMAVFGVGEAFRTGTHKALIFKWLKLQGRTDEKTRVYGLTRSWSKFGSALSALLGALIVFTSPSYAAVFYWSAIPCALNVLNLVSYPRAIDPRPDTPKSIRMVWRQVWSTVTDVARHRRLRGLLFESMGFNGLFNATKDYLQPALVAAAVVWLGGYTADLEELQRAALLVGPVYFLLFLGAGVASRNAHRFAQRAGGDDAAARAAWTGLIVIFVVMGCAVVGGVSSLVILAFVLLHVLQNVWRPIMTSRVYAHVEEQKGATVLSVESQSHRLVTIVLAPLFGWLVDASGSFWPFAAVGASIALAFRCRRRS